MDLNRQDALRRFDRTLEALNGNAEAIVAAHCLVGIPLEDAICAAVHKALTAKASDGDRQLNLIFGGGDRPSYKERKSR